MVTGWTGSGRALAPSLSRSGTCGGRTFTCRAVGGHAGHALGARLVGGREGASEAVGGGGGRFGGSAANTWNEPKARSQLSLGLGHGWVVWTCRCLLLVMRFRAFALKSGSFRTNTSQCDFCLRAHTRHICHIHAQSTSVSVSRTEHYPVHPLRAQVLSTVFINTGEQGVRLWSRT